MVKISNWQGNYFWNYDCIIQIYLVKVYRKFYIFTRFFGYFPYTWKHDWEGTKMNPQIYIQFPIYRHAGQSKVYQKISWKTNKHHYKNNRYFTHSKPRIDKFSYKIKNSCSFFISLPNSFWSFCHAFWAVENSSNLFQDKVQPV